MQVERYWVWVMDQHELYDVIINAVNSDDKWAISIDSKRVGSVTLDYDNRVINLHTAEKQGLSRFDEDPYTESYESPNNSLFVED